MTEFKAKWVNGKCFLFKHNNRFGTFRKYTAGCVVHSFIQTLFDGMFIHCHSFSHSLEYVSLLILECKIFMGWTSVLGTGRSLKHVLWKIRSFVHSIGMAMDMWQDNFVIFKGLQFSCQEIRSLRCHRIYSTNKHWSSCFLILPPQVVLLQISVNSGLCLKNTVPC